MPQCGHAPGNQNIPMMSIILEIYLFIQQIIDVRVPDLMATFDRVQKRELFDESVAEVLQGQYR